MLEFFSMDTSGRRADLNLQPIIRDELPLDALLTAAKEVPEPTQHPVALSFKLSICRYLRPGPHAEGDGAASPAAAQSLAGPGLLPDPGEKTARADTMDVAVAIGLGVIELSGMRWRATTLMLLDLHGHGSTQGLRFRSAASGSAILRQARMERPSAVHPQCEAVLECG
jgi:hypothetical protein